LEPVGRISTLGSRFAAMLASGPDATHFIPAHTDASTTV
jgi:hypothetical protein